MMRTALICCAVLTACKPEPIPEAGMNPDACGASALQDRVGTLVDSYDFSASGKDLRILPPGAAMTMDHRPDRLNVDIDDAGRITRIWCG